MDIGKILVELDEVLSHVPQENVKKIPEEIRKAISENKDKSYTWKYDGTKPFREQEIHEDTLAVLAYLNTEYMLNPEQRDLMRKIYRFNQEKLEREKKKKYKSNTDFLNSSNNSNT